MIAGVLLAGGCSGTTTFEPQASGTDASLRGVCAVDARVAWASGSGGTVLRTTDGGASWRARMVAGAEELDFRDVHAFDANRAWVLSAGAPALILSTVDGGETWQQRHSDPRPGVFFDALAFWDDRAGLAFSDPVDGAFVVVQTSDSGVTWQPIDAEHLPSPRDGEAGFAGSGTCVAVWGDRHAWIGTGGAAARVLRTADRGETWAVATTPLLSGAESQGVFSVVFRDPQRGVIVGGDYTNPTRADGNAAVTEDGGMTWRRAAVPPAGYRSGAAWAGGLDIVAVGVGGADQSHDGGVTWREIVGVTGLHAISFAPGRSDGWAVGAGGRIVRVCVR